MINKALDSMGIGEALELFADQIRNSWTQALNADIDKVDLNSLVISGMGGSSNAAKIVSSLYEGSLTFPLMVQNDYGLPAWVNEGTVVIANTYSGNTEETISGLEEGKRKGAKLFGITTGGKVAEMIKRGEIQGCIIDPKDTNPSGYPKSGFGVSFGALLGGLVKMGVLSIKEDELFGTLDELVKIRNEWDAKETTSWLKGCFPILFGSSPFRGALNAGRNAICELGRTYSQFYDFPEVDHVLIEALQKPIEAKTINRYLFFESGFNHERVKLRYKITKQLFDKQGLTYSTHPLMASSALGQALELVHYCSWLGYYLSLLDNSDPGPEPWIKELKKLLSQPTH